MNLTQHELDKILRRIFQRARREVQRTGHMLPAFFLVVRYGEEWVERRGDIPLHAMSSPSSKDELREVLVLATRLAAPAAVLFMSEVWSAFVELSPDETPEMMASRVTAGYTRSLEHYEGREEFLRAHLETADGTRTIYSACLLRQTDNSVIVTEFERRDKYKDGTERFGDFFGPKEPVQ